MNTLNLIDKYFPYLSNFQKNCFLHLEHLYIEWNAKINIISRKDINHLYERHILHSLSISKIIQFKHVKFLNIEIGQTSTC